MFNSEDIFTKKKSKRLIRLPMHNAKRDDIETIYGAIGEFF